MAKCPRKNTISKIKSTVKASEHNYSTTANLNILAQPKHKKKTTKHTHIYTNHTHYKYTLHIHREPAPLG